MSIPIADSPTKFWKILFLFAGVFNLAAGATGMVVPAIGVTFISGIETAEPGVLFIFFILSFVVALFGLGYLMVAVNAAANRGLVTIGAIAKISLFGIAVYGYLNDLSTLEFMLVVSSDVVWALLFIRYLRTVFRRADYNELHKVKLNKSVLMGT